MAFTVISSIIRVSGNETLATFATWAGSNSGATAHDINTVEADLQIKVLNGAIFDTSLGTLIINHRMEGQDNADTDSGIWKSHGGMCIVQGSLNQYAEYWVVMDFDRAHTIYNKTGVGYQAFFRSNPSAVPISILNSTFMNNTGVIDGHLQFSGGTGVVKDTYFENKDTDLAFLLLRDSDSDGVSLIGIDLGGWSQGLTVPTTFHKNMTFEHTAGGTERQITFYYRRENYPIFYNIINQADGLRMNEIFYNAVGSAGTDGRGIVVGKFEPTFQDENSSLLSGVNIEVRSLTTDIVEQSATTGVDGKVDVSGGVHSVTWNGRDIDEAGRLYVKQSITPADTGTTTSVDQGEFRIRARRRDIQLFQSAQSFVEDFEGLKIIQNDSLYTAGALDFGTVTDIDTAEELYNYYKFFAEDNISETISLNRAGNVVEAGAYDVTINDQAIAPFAFDGSKLTFKPATTYTGGLKSTGTINLTGELDQADMIIDGDLHMGPDAGPPPPVSNISLLKRNTEVSPETETNTTTLPISAPTAGNVLIATIGCDLASGAFNAVSGWTLVNERSQFSQSFGQYFKISDGTETEIVTTWLTARYSAGYVEEFTGFVGTPTVDAVVNNYISAAVLTGSTGTTTASLEPNALAYAHVAFDLPSSFDGIPTVTNGFTSGATSSETSRNGLHTAYKVLSVEGTSETTFTWASGVGDQLILGMLVITDAGAITVLADPDIEVTFDNVTVTGLIYNDYDSNTITINSTGGSSLVSGEASVIINNSVPLSVEVFADGSPLQDARVYLVAAAGGDLPVDTVILTGLTDVNGLISTVMSYTNDQPVIGRVRKSTGSPLYKTTNLAGTITQAGFSASVGMVRDE